LAAYAPPVSASGNVIPEVRPTAVGAWPDTPLTARATAAAVS
jgi:hypothetical protein